MDCRMPLNISQPNVKDMPWRSVTGDRGLATPNPHYIRKIFFFSAKVSLHLTEPDLRGWLCCEASPYLIKCRQIEIYANPQYVTLRMEFLNCEERRNLLREARSRLIKRSHLQQKQAGNSSKTGAENKYVFQPFPFLRDTSWKWYWRFTWKL